MAIIGDIHSFIKRQLKKERSSWLTPEGIDQAINNASLDLFNEYIGHVKQFQQGVLLTGGPERNKKIYNSLRPFKKTATISLTSGIGSLPSDYAYDSMVRTTAGVEAKVIDDKDWSYRLSRITAAPTDLKPVVRLEATSIEASPTTVASVNLSYWALPTDVEWAYTVVSSRPVYDDGSSTDFEWSKEDVPEIQQRALQYLGNRLEDPIISQASNARKQTGL